MSVIESVQTHHFRPRAFPVGSGLAFVAAAIMVAGALGPWIGGRIFGGTHGIDLGGDGWLLVAAAGLATLPLVLPLPPSSIKGLWTLGLALGAAYVCWIHYTQAEVDGFDVVWGLQVATLGSVLLALAGLRLLLLRG